MSNILILCSCIICKKQVTSSSLLRHNMAHHQCIYPKPQKMYNKCKQCNTVILNRVNKFCNSSCAAKFNNSAREPKPIIHCIKPLRTYECKACGIIHETNKDRNICKCNLSTKVQTFKNLSNYFSLDLSKQGSQDFLVDYQKCREYVIALYEKHSLPSLAEYVNHPDKGGGNIAKLLSYLDIPLSNRSQAQHKSLLHNRATIRHNKQYKYGWITAFNKRHFYRSSYELKFANHLISNNIPFDMESLRLEYYDSIQQKTRIAIPDFIINNTIAEIKSNYTLDTQNMIDKFLMYIHQGYTPYLILDGVPMILEQLTFIPVDNILSLGYSYNNF